MRIVFIDIHCVNLLVRTYTQIKSGNKVVTYKHKFLIDYAMQNNIEICSYISCDDSTRFFYPKIKHCNVSRHYFEEEFNYVMRKSFPGKVRVKTLFSPDEISEDDIVIGYLYKTGQLEKMKNLRGIKVLMGNHFVTINNPIDLKENGVSAFANEIDLADNSFVSRYFNIGGVKHITIPYIFANRFVNLNRERKCKAMAIGTLSTCKGSSDYKLYREHTGTEWIQPLRKMIYDNKDYMPEQLDSYISYILEDRIDISDDDSKLIKKIKKVANYCIGWKQKKYMSFDMVVKFNEYSMFVCPEELIGMPGIGFVEGMACGTAYIGLDTAYYRKLGLIPGVNYITYDGSLDGLKNVIEYYQEHVSELQMIAKAGERHVREHFNTSAVAKKFFDQLKVLQNDINKTDIKGL